jgi:hypothetical protein
LTKILQNLSLDKEKALQSKIIEAKTAHETALRLHEKSVKLLDRLEEELKENKKTLNKVCIVDTVGLCDTLFTSDEVYDMISKSVNTKMAYIDKVIIVCSGRIEKTTADAIKQFMRWMEYSTHKKNFVFVYNKCDGMSDAEREHSLVSMCELLGADIEVEDILYKPDGSRQAIKYALATSFPPNVDYSVIKQSIVGSKGLAQLGGIAVNELQIFSPSIEDCSIYSDDFSDLPDRGKVYGRGHKEMYKDIAAFLFNKVPYPVNKNDCLSTLSLLHSFYKSDELGECNKELAENTRLRNLIDVERKRATQAKFILGDLDNDCNKIETEADKHSFKTKKNISEMENIHRTMTHEQCRHEEDQAFFTSELNNLENELVSDKKAKEQQIKDFKEILNNLMTTGNTENLNSTPILRCLNNK